MEHWAVFLKNRLWVRRLGAGVRAWTGVVMLGMAMVSSQPPVIAGPLAIFRTALGNIEVELYEDKPVTTANFLRYVNSGAYSNMIFHRWVPGFVMQGGGFYTANRNTTNAQMEYVTTFGAITNEYNIGRPASNVYGTLAMARVGGQTNSATSQWFFNLANNSTNLDKTDGGFTVFARVVRGTNVLNRFNDVSTTHSLWMLDLGSPLNELPVVSAQPTYEDLLYCDIQLLRLAIRRVNGGIELKWNSVSNIANIVEIRTSLTNTWTTLTSVTGNGQTLQVTNQPSGSPSYYRVRIGY